jgi:hypothetical protein
MPMVPGHRVASPQAGIAGIGRAEHLLVWSWRRIAAGRADCPLIAREFRQLCGEDAAEVLATFGVFLRALAYAGRHRLKIGYPGWAGLTADERQCLMLIAAAQTGDEVCFETHLRWLARAERRPALEISTQALATALEMHDLQLQPFPPIAPIGAGRGAVGG